MTIRRWCQRVPRYYLHYPLAVAVCLSLSAPAAAATFTVNSTADALGSSCAPGSATCTLRAAIQAANAIVGVASTITVPAGTYWLSQLATCGIRTNGDTQIRYVPIYALCITGQLTINGAGAGVTIVDGQQLDRVLVVTADAIAQVNGVTLQNGFQNPSSYPGGANGGGGGVNNQGTLNLTACAISGNIANIDGGGIYSNAVLTVDGCTMTSNNAILNESGGGAISVRSGTAGISNSTLHGNAAQGGGGAVANVAGIVSITSSTLDANTGSQGGAIWNLTLGAMSLTNVTISGNTAGNAGGGVNNSGTLTANNVTIAFNSAMNVAGGLIGTGIMTFGNTIVSGNAAVNFIPDLGCIGNPIISKGYNLVLNGSSCSFTGDQTGNLIGVDPLLTGLLDNGGGTLTLALAAGSPAVDAGSPTAPGAGGNACALADQRGILRPLGARCDIGAFERSAALSISAISTNQAANTGVVETFIRGGGFVIGTTVILRKSGQADIVGGNSFTDPGGADLSASFDLTAAALGLWDVIVANPDLTTATLAGGFTAQAAQAPQLWTTVTGPAAARPGLVTTFNINYGNTGNADALAVPLTISVPAGYSLEAYFPVTPPPAQTGQVALDWTHVPLDILLPQPATTCVSLLLPVVPAGFSGSLPVSIIAPPASAGTSFLIAAPLGAPLLNPNPDPNAVAQVAAGAVAYALANLGITIPNSHLPALSQYATNQLTLAVGAGRAVIGSSLGGWPLVYSLSQFSIDAAEFGAANAAGLPQFAESKTAARHQSPMLKASTPVPLDGAGPPTPGAGGALYCPPRSVLVQKNRSFARGNYH